MGHVIEKGSKNKADHYRPISHTCGTCELVEHVFASSLMSQMGEDMIPTDAGRQTRTIKYSTLKTSCQTQKPINIAH